MNFVDDSNSVIALKPGGNMELYINCYFNLLEIYYNSQKLKINTDKTQLLISAMPRHIGNNLDITLITEPKLPDVKPMAQIKILGYLINTRGDIESRVNSIVSATSALFHLAELHIGELNLNTRKSYVFAHIISRLNYIMPFVAGHPIHVQEKIMKIWVRSAKFIYGNGTLGVSHEDLFKYANFPIKSNIFESASATWIQKIIHNQEPKQIIDLLRLPRNRDKCKPAPTQPTRSARFKRTAIINGIKNFNKIHPSTQILKPTKCKLAIKNYVLFTKADDLKIGATDLIKINKKMEKDNNNFILKHNL